MTTGSGKSVGILTYEDRVYLESEEPALSILSNKKETPIVKQVKKDLVKKDATEYITRDGKVAIFSSRNTTWSGVGKVYRGINLVDVEKIEDWLTRPSIRLVTEQEFKKEFK